MTGPLRAPLQGGHPAEVSHLGLALARYLPASGAKKEEAKELLMAALTERFGQNRPDFPAGYQASHERWQRAASGSGRQVRVLTLVSRGRAVVGLGTDSPLENSLSTHHTYGVPVLPGSALKGLASSFAASHFEGWERDREDGPFLRLFGSTEGAGLVTILDALPVPGTWRLHREVMTVHHQAYYGGGDVPPADWDDPVPVPFLSVSGTFTLILSAAPGEEGRDALTAMADLLTQALNEEGLGAKTSSGFGRFEVQQAAQATPDAVPAGGTSPSIPAPPSLPTWLSVVLAPNARWTPNDLQNRQSPIWKAASRLPSEAEQGTLTPDQARQGAQGILKKFAPLQSMDPKDFRKNPWYPAVLALAES